MNTSQFLHIESMRHFAADGLVYRAFNHLIAARMGALLLVPFHRVQGSFEAVVDGCPVPWEEVYAVLDYPAVHTFTNPARWNIHNHVRQLESFGIDPAACELDYIAPMMNGEEKVLRLVHPYGVRFAVVTQNV